MTQNTRQRLALGIHLSAAGGVSKAIDAAIELDIDSLQIFTRNNNRWQTKPIDSKEIDRFHERHQQWGPERQIFSHGSYLINMASPDEELWAKSVEAFKDEYQRADSLALTGLVMHPGAHVGSGVDGGLERVAKGILETINSFPEGKTRILLENTAGQGSTLGRSFEELSTLLHHIDAPTRVGICLDSCHLLAAGYDLTTATTYQETMAQFDSLLGVETLFCWHLNDSRGKLGSHLDRHENIGDGEVGLEGFRQILNDARFDGISKILETPKKDDMDPVNLSRLRELAL